MKASIAAASALLLFSLASTPADALVSNVKALQTVAASPIVVPADFVQGHEAIAGVSARQALVRSEASKVMAQRYFDVDVIITLAALALASGAFVAAGIAGGRRRSGSNLVAAPNESWREDVMLALETDLAQFSAGLRRAA